MRPRTVIGVFAVVILAAVLIARGGTGSRYEVTAVVDSARGLVAGADVRAAGIDVGKVKSVELGADGLPRVRMAIDDGYRLHRTARAAVRMASLSGEFNRYVSLSQGTGPQLRDGAVLPPSQTSAPVEVDEALSAFAPRTRADVRAVLDRLDAATTGRGPDLSLTLRSSARALRQVAGLAGDVGADGHALRTLVADTHRVTATLAGRPAPLADSVDAMAALLRTTGARARDLREAVSTLPAALRAPQHALATANATIPTLRTLVRAIAPGTRQLRPAAGELSDAVAAARPVLRDARGLGATGPADLRALTPLVREARPTLEQLTPVLRRTGPMLDQARVRLPDFFSFFSNWADFTAAYDANGHGARVGIVLPPAPTNVLSPSGDGPGQLKAPYLRTPGSLAGQPWTDYASSFVAGGKAAPDVDPAGGGR